VLVKVEACGICGTDLNILAVPPAHKATPNIIIGHEGTGLVEKTGPDVTNLNPGDRVVIAPRLTCGRCYYCNRGMDNQCTDYQSVGTSIDGAFAPYMVLPNRALYKLDASVHPDDAVFFEPLSCVVGALSRVPFQAGDQAVVIGAGPMGALFGMTLKTMGAGQVIMTDLSEYRLDFVTQIGIDARLNATSTDLPQSIRDMTGYGADLIVDAVGNQIDTAIRLGRRGANVILFGLRPHDNPPVNQYTITRHELTLHGSFVGLKPFVQTVQLLESGRIHPGQLITHRIPLAQLEQGVELMRSGQAMKVIVEMI
jgi:threonine dehydrogenase-like Zn-dependent dehydrogenase